LPGNQTGCPREEQGEALPPGREIAPMKIVVTADLHADETADMGTADMDRLCHQVHWYAPDVLIIAGVLVGLGKSYIAPTLERLAPRNCLKLIVPGNHDLWLEGADSYRYYRDMLPAIYEDCGYHMLDMEPKVVGRVAFVGSIGWYDYTFRDPRLPLAPDKMDYDYERKTWGGMPNWMDAVYVRLGMSDVAFNSLLLSRLRAQLQALPKTVKTIVAISHHIAFEKMVGRKDHDLEWSFCNAFQGSRGLGELLLEDPRIKYHFCGHSHFKGRVRRDGLTSINVGSTYRRKRLEVVEVP
jgi:hypothetical protein